ncbi:Gfo/Idh/MocA family oxidoreductase [Actinomycetospora sp. NBRC 106378]|uniref:Gfo/Idh/MocA family protein n=1 Tax=Actinomycetospora sp. NBRC 106378 TaxID=3032208 RepID=UPI0024A15230|nr:Gfo/Idh/MocA family oxidoreductase [Actinomycetospora sp. NBRC 106378]GLZ52856.1 putative oxidoreductase [Actinomycetospora sp. NBRC 106378]
MQTIRWGIAGPGRIAANVARDLVAVEGTEFAAVGSRSAERAEAFAAEHGAARAHGSYRALVDDPDVDAIYIATPHPQHADLAVAALEAGKAVLVEKTFTATLAGAWRVVDTARRHGVFAMEAMWTRFQPAVVRAREIYEAGEIGEVRSVQADLGTVRDVDPDDRLFNAELGGGALLDLAVYPVSFAQMVLGGSPSQVHAVGRRETTGVDAENALVMAWEDGRFATAQTSFHSPSPGQARIFGSTGWIDVLPRFHHPTTIVVHRSPDDPGERLELPATGAGYSHEIVEVNSCLRAGRTESAVMPLDDTLAVQGVLAEAADQLGLTFSEATLAL